MFPRRSGARSLSALLIAVSMMSPTSGRSQSAPANGAPDRDAFQRAQEFDKVPNTPGDGPYPAIIETDPSLPDHVIYRPKDLSPFDRAKLPILAWGNGGCADDGTAHRLYLAQIASYGYIVVAAGSWRSGPGASAPRAERKSNPGGGLPAVATTAADVLAGLNWAISENGKAGSRFRGKVATKLLAVAGHSCGGLQAIQLAADPRIKTVIINNSGIFNEAQNPIPGMTVSKDMLGKFHMPVLYLLGGPGDIAYDNGMDDFNRVTHVPIALADLPVGHGGTFSEPMGGAVAHVAVDWLEWQLRGDKGAARTFLGSNCRLCSGTNWTIQRKGFSNSRR